MANLSNDYTAAKVWREAVRELPNAINITSWDKFDVLNRAQQIAQGLVAEVVAPRYRKVLVPVFDGASKVGSSGMSWTAATKTLTATMSVAFASTDEGKWVDFFNSTDLTVGYGGIIDNYVSTTSVVLTGDNLPASDIAIVSNLNVLSTTPAGDVLDISAARVLWSAPKELMKLFSTATNYVRRAESDEDFEQFQSASPQEANAIIWNPVGTSIYLDKGDSLSNYGTFKFHYPSLPTILTLDADYMDVLDGSMVQLTIAITKNLIARRIGEPKKQDNNELAMLMQAIFRENGKEIALDDAIKRANAV